MNTDESSSIMSLECGSTDVEVQSDGDIQRIISREKLTRTETKLDDMPEWKRCKKYIRKMLRLSLRYNVSRMLEVFKILKKKN